MSNMDLREAATRVPELHALPIYWAAASLTVARAQLSPIGHSETLSDADRLLAMLEDEVEAILDEEPQGIVGTVAASNRHPLDCAAAMIWRSVSGDRRHAVVEDLFVQLEEIAQE